IVKDGVESLFVGVIENGGPQEGSSTHEFRLKASELPVDGNYKLSITAGNQNQFNTSCKLYITNFKVEKLSASDLEACQMISPVSVTEAEVSQQVQCYVRNVGACAATDIKAYYQVDNGRVVEQTLDGTLAPQETRLHTFSVPVMLTEGVHKIKYWFKDANDIKPQNDTSLTYTVNVSKVGSFSNFDFAAEAQTYGWHAYSDTTERNPLWNFASQAPFYPQAKTYSEEANATHDDYLVSPWFELKKGQIYQVDLTFETILGNAEVLGEKRFSVWLANSNRREDILTQKKLIWDAGVLRRKGERTMTFFFEVEKDTVACVVFRSNGPASDGSIRINHFSLQKTRTNKMNLVYDFEPYFSSDAISQAKEYMTFVDQDWNALMKLENKGGVEVPHEVEPTVTSGWEVKKESLGYSAYAKGIQDTANDWLIFNPMELKAGKYYLHFRSKKQGSSVSATNGKCALEVYLQNTYPRYEQPYADQQGW
ncbi:MAG: hypothetical protein K2M92_03300, partial [Bacteroidales bacterium]|nr:hypothetical protein [Bacteroidales bacterium]